MRVSSPAYEADNLVEVPVDAGGTPAGGAYAGPDEWPSKGRAWYAVFLLAIVLMISQLDRGVINLLVTPIKRDLHLSDTQLSELVGLAFILLYMFMGIPLARLSDRKQRRFMIAGGVTFWSLCTVACGLAQGFTSLFICRVGIGAGEAVNGPATYSLLADYFPPARLPRALAALNLGFLAGAGGSLLIGAAVIHLLPNVPDIPVPFLGVVHNWQLVFMVVGLPGLIIAVLMALMYEPPRHGKPRAAGEKPLPFSAVLKYLGKNGRVYGPMFAAVAISTVGTQGSLAWQPTFYLRTFGWTASEAGTWMGLISLGTGLIGLYLGARLSERYDRKNYHDANLRVALIALVLAAPFAIAAPLMPTPYLALGLFSVAGLIAIAATPCLTAALQLATPNQFRGQISSLYLLMVSAIGMGLGPLLVARFTNGVLHDESLLRYSLSLTALVCGPTAIVLLLIGIKPYGRLMERIKRDGHEV